jgi:hypothetical protein
LEWLSRKVATASGPAVKDSEDIKNLAKKIPT